jgi:hypothetical protein
VVNYGWQSEPTGGLKGRWSIGLSICLSTCVSVYLFICVFVYLSLWLSVYLSVYLSICLCVGLCLFIGYLSICLSICAWRHNGVLIPIRLAFFPSISLKYCPCHEKMMLGHTKCWQKKSGGKPEVCCSKMQAFSEN